MTLVPILAAAMTAAGLVPAPEGPDSPVGRKVEAFRLRDHRGAEHALAEFADRRLVVLAFVACECPLAKLYGPRLAELAREYEPRGVAFVGVNANQQDSATAVGRYAKAHGIAFPVLKDVGNVLADRLGAQRTPEVFVLDAERVVRYAGRIDDQYGVGFARPRAGRRDLASALDELLAAKPVSVVRTVAPGCFIGRVRKASASGEVTYAGHVAPVLQRHCVVCHRAGQIAPFALTSYDEVAGWTATIEEVVREGRMPPWHADPKYGRFANDARLPEEEKKLILDWIRDGAPPGDPKDLPAPAAFAEGWRIPKPDAVFTMPKPFRVPAQGDVPYQFVAIDPGFSEDKWVRAVEVRPGCRSVVHHVLVFVQAPGGDRRRQGDFASRWIAAMAPGSPPQVYPEGTAKLVPAGSRFLFQIHYTPDGSPKEDQTCMGLVFADPKSVRQEVTTEMAAEGDFEIPPGHPNYQVEATHTLREESVLLDMLPHTHLRGKAFRYEAIYPGGEREVLLDLPRYDFNWQNRYVLAEPKTLPKGTRIHCTAHYDNSRDNRSNPDPAAAVRWGDQTWEEMMIGYFSVMPAGQDLQRHPRPAGKVPARPPVTLDPELVRLSGQALESDDAFDAFAAAVRKALPQVDRVCFTHTEGGVLRVERASYPGPVERKLALAGFESQSKANALGYFALINRVTVMPDLAKAFGVDLKQMSQSLGSSVHVPAVRQGVPGTLNFWSKDRDAFPASAQDTLRAVTDAVLGKS
jgi:peroxiredoxin